MRSLRAFSFVITIALCMGFTLTSFADESLAIITQHSNPLQSLSLETLKRIYLRKSLLDPMGTRWIPLNLPVDHELRQQFSVALFKKLPEEQEEYWNEQYFQGVNPPDVLASEEAVLRFIVITPGAIGYINKRTADDRVKILKIISIPEHN